MTYSNAWSTAIPLGSDSASNADNDIRQTRLDVSERLDHLVSDITADPIVTLANIIRRHPVYGTQQEYTGGSSVLMNGAAVGSGTTVPITLFMSFPDYLTGNSLIVLNNVNVRVYTGIAADSVTASVKSVDDSNSESSHVSGTDASTGWETIVLNAALTLVATRTYWVELTIDPNAAAANALVLYVEFDYTRLYGLQGV